jgi:3-hydroxyacyl-CoA dehydrogenase
MEPKSTIAIAGAGTMGNGIAHVFAGGGFEVLLYDIQQPFLDRVLTTIQLSSVDDLGALRLQTR